MKLLKNDRGTTAVEFAMSAMAVIWFILGIMQTGYIVWIDNLLNVSVDAAARCGAVQSTTSPCQGSGLANMQNTANLVFGPMSGATFSNNTNCSADGGTGLIGTYNVSIVFVANLTLTANSCYPTVAAPS
jgi:Flp pilus assembly protein TadG